MLKGIGVQAARVTSLLLAAAVSGEWRCWRLGWLGKRLVVGGRREQRCRRQRMMGHEDERRRGEKQKEALGLWARIYEVRGSWV